MPLFVSHNVTRTPEEADPKPIHRCSTTISMMEEEFGMRTPPLATGRFGERVTRRTPVSQVSPYFYLKGIPSKLWILPPKRRHSTQAPEPPRRSSFLEGPWESIWDCDAEGSCFVQIPPDEDACGHLDGVLGGAGVQGEELADQEVTTPISDASWSTDGEATPLFSSKFPRQPDQRDLWYEGKLYEEPIAADDAPIDRRLN